MSNMPEDQPLVSVGIPTYNRPEGLKHTLACITGQSYRNLEIIVSDNCSPNENVRKVVEQVAATDARVRYYRQSSTSCPTANFEFVLNKASGRFFMWAADDDSWEETFIETGVRTLLADPFYSAWFCSVDQIDEHGKTILTPPSLCCYTSTRNRRADLFRYLRAPRIMMKDCITYSIFDRDALLKIAPFLFYNPRGNCGEFRTALLTRYNIAISDKILYHKRISSKSLQKMIDEGGSLTHYSHRGKNLYGGEFSIKRSPNHFRQQYLACRGTGYAGTVMAALVTQLPSSITAYIVSRAIRKTRSIAKRVGALMRR